MLHFTPGPALQGSQLGSPGRSPGERRAQTKAVCGKEEEIDLRGLRGRTGLMSCKQWGRVRVESKGHKVECSS